MKTNQRVTVAFNNGAIDFDHLTRMGDLTQLFFVGNTYRIERMIRPINFTHFMDSKATNEFLDEIARVHGVEKETLVCHNGRKGKASRTFADLHFLIYCASQLDVSFNYEIINTFINSKILELRDDGGDDFKTLNKYMDGMSDRIEGKKNNGLYIQVSQRIRAKIFGHDALEFDEKKRNGELPKSANIWNQEIATAEKQRLRTQYESNLSKFIEMGFVDSKEEVYKAIEKL